MERERRPGGASGGPDGRVLNLFQLLALSVALGALAGAVAFGSGLSLAAAGLVAWAGTVLGALGVTSILFLADALSARRSQGETADADLRDAIEAWGDDLMREAMEAELRSAARENDGPIAASHHAIGGAPGSGGRGIG